MKNFTVNDINRIKVAEELFSNNLETAKQEYRKLSSQFHPDKNLEIDSSIFAKISTLYEEAILKISNGSWFIPGLLQLQSIDKKNFEIKYKINRQFELGEMYIADTHVTYRVDIDNKDLAENFIRKISKFYYKNEDMKKEFSRYLPKLKNKIETKDHIYLVIEKTSDLISLRDVLQYYNNKLDPKHVAWIVSRLYNLGCYLKFNNLVHGNIDLDSVFISPEYHSATLFGGWWYTTSVDNKFHALPSRTIDNGPCDTLISKTAKFCLDLDIIKTTGKELLGDISGSKLLMNKEIPISLLQWLKTSSSNDSFAEYKQWMTIVLKKSFGERKFFEMKLRSDMI